MRDWQVGDGREEALADYVLANARRGDPNDVIRVIDDFAYNHSVIMNVGDEKGDILDRAIRRASPRLSCSSSEPIVDTRLCECHRRAGRRSTRSIESLPANAAIAHRILSTQDRTNG